MNIYKIENQQNIRKIKREKNIKPKQITLPN